MLEVKKKLVAVEEFTTPSPVTVTPDTPVADVIKMMDEYEIRHLPVVQESMPVGIISDRDLRLALNFQDSHQVPAARIMSVDPYTVSPESSIDEVAFHMSKNKIGSAIVQDAQGQIVGIFTSTDALNALVEVMRGMV